MCSMNKSWLTLVTVSSFPALIYAEILLLMKIQLAAAHLSLSFGF